MKETVPKFFTSAFAEARYSKNTILFFKRAQNDHDTPPERQKLKRLTPPNVAKDMEQLEPSDIAGGSIR